MMTDRYSKTLKPFISCFYLKICLKIEQDTLFSNHINWNALNGIELTHLLNVTIMFSIGGHKIENEGKKKKNLTALILVFAFYVIFIYLCAGVFPRQIFCVCYHKQQAECEKANVTKKKAI